MNSDYFHKILFLDTEFTGLNQATTLISLAMVADTGEEFYAEFTDYDQSQISPWVAEQVIANLFLDTEHRVLEDSRKLHIMGNSGEIRLAMEGWIRQFGDTESSIQLWGDCHPWDWVLFCELFGGAFGIPKTLHFMPMDLATLFYVKNGDPDIDREQYAGEPIQKLPSPKKHNALYDAHLIRICYEKLTKEEKL